MDSLRLILLLIGIAIIVAIYLYTRFRKDSLHHPREIYLQSLRSEVGSGVGSNSTSTPGSMSDESSEVIVDPSVYSFASGSEDQEGHFSDTSDEIEDELSELGRYITIDGQPQALDFSSQEVDTPSEQIDELQAPDDDGLVEKVMVIYLLAQPGEKFTSADIVRVVEDEGLLFGNDGYFHRYADTQKMVDSIFGIANILEPGLFNLSNNDHFVTPGLVFFQRLSNTGEALEAFDDMLETVINFRDKLDGRLQDSGRNSLNKNSMMELREQVSTFSQQNQLTSF